MPSYLFFKIEKKNRIQIAVLKAPRRAAKLNVKRPLWRHRTRNLKNWKWSSQKYHKDHLFRSFVKKSSFASIRNVTITAYKENMEMFIFLKANGLFNDSLIPHSDSTLLIISANTSWTNSYQASIKLCLFLETESIFAKYELCLYLAYRVLTRGTNEIRTWKPRVSDEGQYNKVEKLVKKSRLRDKGYLF